jgi:hypothetical protein
MIADPEYAEDHFATVFADQDDFDPAQSNDEQRVAGIMLEEDDASAGIELFSGQLTEALKLGPIQTAEQRDGRQEIARGCRHSRQ